MALFSFAAPALAGCFVVGMLEELPACVGANEPLTISLVVRQHGLQALTGLILTAIVRYAATGARLIVAALPAKGAGHYAARLEFPRAGTWE